MYIAKLQEVGLTLEVDPYSKERGRNFETNMTILASARVQSYFGYFITYRGLYNNFTMSTDM